MCGGRDRNRERRKAEKKARRAQKRADRKARARQKRADQISAQRQAKAQEQVEQKAYLNDIAKQKTIERENRITDATNRGLEREQQIRDNAAAEEARIKAESEKRVRRIRTAGGALSASMVALDSDKKDAKAPTAGSTKGKKKPSGPRATAALIQRGSARTRGTNLSI